MNTPSFAPTETQKQNKRLTNILSTLAVAIVVSILVNAVALAIVANSGC
jgi:hypothetical protein